MSTDVNVTKQAEHCARAAKLLAAHPFQPAKTMPDNPHSYTLKKHWVDSDYEFCHRVIDAYGTPVTFGRKVYRQWYCNGYFYWTMSGVHESEVLNRKTWAQEPLVPPQYGPKAEVYDRFYDQPEYQHENTEVALLLAPLVAEATQVIDLGCGTGLLLDLEHPDGGKLIPDDMPYLGVEPDPAMLRVFTRKHPERAWMCCLAEDCWIRYDTPRPLVVGLFGSPAYIANETLRRFDHGATVFMMSFTDGYEPRITVSDEGHGPHRTPWPEPLFGKYEVVSP